MGKLVIKDAVVTVEGVDLSQFVKSVAIESEKDDVDLTAMGAENKEHGVGLGDATITVGFFQALGAAEVDATLWPFYKNETQVTIAVKATSDAVSATNPEYRMEAKMFSYAPLNAEVGAASETEVEFKNAAQQGLRRYTAAGTYT